MLDSITLRLIYRSILVQQNKAMGEKLRRAQEIQNEISKIENDPNFVGKNDLKNLEDQVVTVKNLLTKGRDEARHF